MRLSLKVNNGYDFVYNYLSIDNRQHNNVYTKVSQVFKEADV